MLRAREKGSPRSRANDQVIREAAAKQPIALQNSRRTMMLTIMVAPASEPTAWRKMRRKGAVAAVSSASSPGISCALNKTANSMPKAKIPLITRLRSIDLGTSVLAFLTSSDICNGQRRVTNYVRHTYMNNRVGSNESQSIALQTNKEGQSLSTPCALVMEGREDLLG